MFSSDIVEIRSVPHKRFAHYRIDGNARFLGRIRRFVAPLHHVAGGNRAGKARSGIYDWILHNHQPASFWLCLFSGGLDVCGSVASPLWFPIDSSGAVCDSGVATIESDEREWLLRWLQRTGRASRSSAINKIKRITNSFNC